MRCEPDNPAGSKFCFECGTPLAWQAPAPRPLRPVSPRSYTPGHLAEKILTSRLALEGERKQVTVLFADIKGSLEWLADRDPEEARQLLDPVLERMMAAVHSCHAALAMQDTIRRYSEELRRSRGIEVRIRVGLSFEVVVRAIANDLHMDYTADGAERQAGSIHSNGRGRMMLPGSRQALEGHSQDPLDEPVV